MSWITLCELFAVGFRARTESTFCIKSVQRPWGLAVIPWNWSTVLARRMHLCFVLRKNPPVQFVRRAGNTWNKWTHKKNKICSGLNVAIALVYVVGLLCFQRATGLLDLRSDGGAGIYSSGHQSRPWPPQENYSPGHQSRPWPSQDGVRILSRRLLETTISPNSTGRTDCHFWQMHWAPYNINAEVGGPQISSANRKSPILRTNRIFIFADPPQVWQFADWRFADPIFFCYLQTQLFLRT
jgi:hypothetical protein